MNWSYHPNHGGDSSNDDPGMDLVNRHLQLLNAARMESLRQGLLCPFLFLLDMHRVNARFVLAFSEGEIRLAEDMRAIVEKDFKDQEFILIIAMPEGKAKRLLEKMYPGLVDVISSHDGQMGYPVVVIGVNINMAVRLEAPPPSASVN